MVRATPHARLTSKAVSKPAGRETEKLSDAVGHLLEECRMVLPGVQALFGFQWVAFFNQRFSDLSGLDKKLHLAAIFLVAVSAALIMTPAAYHRSLGGEANQHFLTVSTRLIFASMFLLSLGVALDFYVVSTFIFAQELACLSLAIVVWSILAIFWFAFPRIQAARDEDQP